MTVIETTTTRTIDGAEVPAAGTYAIDASHSQAGFVVRHLMVSKVRGAFTGVSGTVTVADDVTASMSRSRSTPPPSTPGTPAATSTCARPTSSGSRSSRPSPTAAPASVGTAATGASTAS